MKTPRAITLDVLHKDPKIKRLCYKARGIHVKYALVKQEMILFKAVVSKAPRKDAIFNFDGVIDNLARIQSYLDRLVEMRFNLRECERKLKRLYRKGSAYIGSFASLQTIRTKDQRSEVIDELLEPIVDKQAMAKELMEGTEELSWNLKEAVKTTAIQVDAAKQSMYYRNPARLLNDDRKAH